MVHVSHVRIRIVTASASLWMVIHARFVSENNNNNRVQRPPSGRDVSQPVSSVAKIINDELHRFDLQWLLVLDTVQSPDRPRQKMAHAHKINGRWYLTSSAHIDELLQTMG